MTAEREVRRPVTVGGDVIRHLSCASARRLSGLAVAQRHHCVHIWQTRLAGSVPGTEIGVAAAAISAFRAT